MDIRKSLRVSLLDLRRALTGRWFVIALLATLGTLLVAIGRDLLHLDDWMMYGSEPRWDDLLRQGMQGQFAALTLPALSALPAAGQALLEVQTGTARYSIFRAGWRHYVLGKTLACLLGGVLAQALAFLLLLGALQGIRIRVLAAPFPLNSLDGALSMGLARAICGGIWVAVGSALALMTETPSAATIGPLCLFYTLLMVVTRFFPTVPAVNPVNWLGGPSGWLLLGLLVSALGQALVLRRKVHDHA